MERRLLAVVLLGTLLPAAAWSQPSLSAPRGLGAPKPPSGARGPNVEVDPIRCWWRTSAGAVRIGEIFSVVLTCAVLQNEAVQVVPDESRLDASVIQMAPFEVVGGGHPADLYGPNRRFFQYEYRLRVISPDVIGRDVAIPDPQIHYRINSTIAANMALRGRDHTYLLPPQSVRVLSLVPTDAPDIRDSATEGFGAAEQLVFRANVLQIAAFTAMALGGLVALAGAVRLIVRTRKSKPAGIRGLAEAAILRLASRELEAVRREKDVQEWNDALVARALAAARITAASAVGRPISQQPWRSANADRQASTGSSGCAATRPVDQSGEGRLLAGGWGRTFTVVSGAATPEDLSRALDTAAGAGEAGRAGRDAARRQRLEDLRSALVTFTTAQYGREATLEKAALDEALARATAVTRQLRSAHGWPKSYFRRWTPRVQMQQQA